MEAINSSETSYFLRNTGRYNREDWTFRSHTVRTSDPKYEATHYAISSSLLSLPAVRNSCKYAPLHQILKQPESPTDVTMESISSGMWCTSSSVFRRKYCLQLQGRRISKKTQKAGSKLSIFFLLGLYFNPEKWRTFLRYVVGLWDYTESPRRRQQNCTFNKREVYDLMRLAILFPFYFLQSELTENCHLNWLRVSCIVNLISK